MLTGFCLLSCVYICIRLLWCVFSFCIIQIKETEKIQRQSRVGMLYLNFLELRIFQKSTMRSFQGRLVNCMGRSVGRDLCCQGLQIPSLSALPETRGEKWLPTFRGSDQGTWCITGLPGAPAVMDRYLTLAMRGEEHEKVLRIYLFAIRK